MRLRSAPQQTNDPTNDPTCNNNGQRRRRRTCATLLAVTAVSALGVILAVTSLGRRGMDDGGAVINAASRRQSSAPTQPLSDTIGRDADHNVHRTKRTPAVASKAEQTYPRRRLEDTDEDEDMDQHRGHHHDEDGGEITEESQLSENDQVESVESSEQFDGSDDDRGKDVPQPSLYNPEPKPESELELSTTVESITEEEQMFRIQEMAERLRPRPMLNFDTNATKQFAHLHHMKTGGTSINKLLNCALGRARRLYQQTQIQPDADTGGASRRGQVLPFYSLQECSHSRYLSCINDNSTSAQSCRSNIASASVMQYCAPLHQMSRFDWLDADIVTVIRHPVDRVWSMFRFQTKSCFQCTPLLDIYRHIEEGTLDEFCGETGCGGICIPQLLNHETRNLLTDTWDENDAGGESLSTDEEKLREALFNINNRVALVGVTDELPVFAQMLGKVFPWLAESVTAEELGMAIEGDDGASRRKLEKTTATAATAPKTCPLAHANASPNNNRCAPGNKHWALPDEPDDETREAILRHNQLDLKIYEAAKARFQVQKEALGLHKK